MLPLVLLLAQACVGEIDLQGDPEECAVMWHILDEKPGSLEKVTRAYISIFKTDTSRSRWIRNLRLDRQKPHGFPSDKARWEGSNERGWDRILLHALHFVMVAQDHPCPKANQFGGPVDGRHADDHVPWCWKRVSCGEGFAQAYYHRPAGGCEVKTVPASAVISVFRN